MCTPGLFYSRQGIYQYYFDQEQRDDSEDLKNINISEIHSRFPVINQELRSRYTSHRTA